jgi:transcriptional regulator with XRE-family HTH domain
MLKELIKSKGFKQKFVADKVGVSEVTLSNWVKGKTTPNDAHIAKLSQVLNTSIELLQNHL